VRHFRNHFVLGALKAIAILSLLWPLTEARAYDVDDYIRDWQRAGMVKAGLKAVSNALPGGTLPSTAYPLLAPDGAIGAPSYSFASIPTAGLYVSGGNVQLNAAGSNTVASLVATGFSIGNSGDVILARDGADILAQRRTTNAQTFRVYNTFTDASNYERGAFEWLANVLTIGTENAGTGSVRSVSFIRGGSTLLTLDGDIRSFARLIFNADNANDIGASGSSRPRTIYPATSIVLSGPTGFVNGYTLAAAATTVDPTITATGDANANAVLSPNGTGSTKLGSSTATAVITRGAAPAMGACGTSPSVVGNNNAMLVTIGTGGAATSCAVTFANGGFTTNAPVCNAMNNTDRVAYNIATTTTTVTITAAAAFTASSKLHILCTGWL
jgi:hypothetical protein